MFEPNYEHLFSFLKSIDFEDISSSDYERVFARKDTDIILAFSMLDNATTTRNVRPADLLSTETRLVHHGLIAPDSLIELMRKKHAEEQAN
jgi:hypothetical protein